jgi:hypothetical protein
MNALRARRRGKSGLDSRAGGSLPAAVDIDEEQRRHLIECCAFFRAQRYRESGPGRYRKVDLRAARADIDRIIRPAHGKKQR